MHLRIGMIVQEILVVFRAYLLGHLLDCSGHSGIGRKLEKVTDIASPAAEVCGALIAGMVRHIHCAKHVCKVDLIAIGQRKDIQATQCNRICTVCLILLGNIAGKGSVFRSAEGGPCAGCVFFNTTTDVVDDQCRGLLIRVLTGKSIGIFLKGSQRSEKIRVL